MDNDLGQQILKERLELRNLLLAAAEALAAPAASGCTSMLNLPVIDQAALLPARCSCGRGPVSIHPIGCKDATQLCVASPAACRPQQSEERNPAMSETPSNAPFVGSTGTEHKYPRPEKAPASESTDALILAELKAIRALLEGADRPLLVEVA